MDDDNKTDDGELQAPFEVINGSDDNLYSLFYDSNTTIVYGTSGQGKTWIIREFIDSLLKEKNSLVVIIKGSKEREDKELIVYSRKYPKKLLFKNFSETNIGLVDYILEEKEKEMDDYFAGKKTQDEKVYIVFDDIQGDFSKGEDDLSKDLKLSKNLMLKLKNKLKTLSVQGRHYDIKTYILLQHYKSIPKIVRSNANVFCALCPPDDEYIRTLWEEYFRRCKFDDFAKFVRKVPRYSKLLKKKSTGEVYLIAPTRRD